jgi:hypothetical protein
VLHRECPVLQLGLAMLLNALRSGLMEIRTGADEVILGVDTHLDTHVGAVINEVGHMLGTFATPTNAEGYRQLLNWARSFGNLQRAVNRVSQFGRSTALIVLNVAFEASRIRPTPRVPPAPCYLAMRRRFPNRKLEPQKL